MRVLISGSTGLIGTALTSSLHEDGAEVVRLVRRPPAKGDELFWDPSKGRLDPGAVEGFDAVVHLAGAGIGDRRWTEKRRRLILDSRVDSTQLLAARLAEAERKPAVFISGSAIGFYGARDEDATEADGPPESPDFGADVVGAWEAATGAAQDAGIRTTHIRSGIVLAAKGGTLGKLLPLFKFGVGGKLGSGETWWSWISLADEVRAIKHLIATPLSGPVNLTAPNPVTNAELTKTLGRVLGRPTFLSVPRFALEVVMGKDLAASLVFNSARILPAKLEKSGFEFRHRNIEVALRDILNR